MTIGERWTAVGGRASGFDYLRVGLALAVAIWHSFQVAYGTPAALGEWATSPIGFALELILPMFFALSGFLVAGSMYRNPDLRTFLSLRAIRIYPALVVEVVLVAFVLGPIVTQVPLPVYFGDHQFHAYLLNMFGLIHFTLPGVFVDNPYPNIINSQLWTVPWELECYIVAGIIFLLGFFRFRSRVLPIFIVFTVLYASLSTYQGNVAAMTGGWSGRLLVLCFVAGLVLHAHKDRIPLRLDLAIMAVALTVILPLIYDPLTYLVPLPIAYAVAWLGLRNPPRSIVIDSGDYSYGIYLYSNPIEQTVQYALPHVGFFGNIAIALPVTIAFALFSWWCIEKPFQKVKRFVLAKRPERPVSSQPVLSSPPAVTALEEVRAV